MRRNRESGAKNLNALVLGLEGAILPRNQPVTAFRTTAPVCTADGYNPPVARLVPRSRSFSTAAAGRVSVPLAKSQGSLIVPEAIVGDHTARPTTHATSILGENAHVP